MNKHVDPTGAPINGTPSSDLIALVLSIVGKPNAEQLIDSGASALFRRDNPGYAGLTARAEDLLERCGIFKNSRARHVHEQSLAPLLKPKHFGPRSVPLSGYERAQFYFHVLAALVGVAMSMHALASYISDSDVVSFLSGNYFGSLLVSALPFLGVFALKTRGPLGGSEEAERAFYIRLCKYGLLSLTVYFVAVSIVFAPQKVDISAIRDALTNGTEPSSWLANIIKSVGEHVVFGSQLFAETLLAPLAALKAEMIDRSGRSVSAPISEVQIVHDAAIANINKEIDLVTQDLSHAQAQLAAHVVAERAQIDAALKLYQNLTADLDATEKRLDATQKRAREEVFEKYTKKGGSR